MTGLATVGRVLALAYRLDPRTTRLATALILVQAAVLPLTGLAQRALIRADTPGEVLTAAALGALGYAILAVGLRQAHNFRVDLTHHTTIALGAEMMTLATATPAIDDLDDPTVLDRLHLLRTETEALASVCWVWLETAAAAVSVAFSVWLLAGVHPLLALLVPAALPPLWLGVLGARVVRRTVADTTADRRVEDSLHALFLDRAAARDIAVSGIADLLGNRADALAADVQRRRDRAEAMAALLRCVGWASFSLLFAAGLVVAVGTGSAGDVLLFAGLGLGLRVQVAGVVDGLRGLAAAGHVVRHYEWLWTRRTERTGALGPPDRLRDGITLEAVCCDRGHRRVLVGVNLHLRAGSVVALVGENGAGKTTLVDVLSGLRAPSAGRVLVDGTPLAELTGFDARVAMVRQEYATFEFSLRENVGVGHLPWLSDDVRVLDALAVAGARSQAELLPDGLDTGLGTGGSDLSRGQWQRLALARAAMRPDPLLLVLDEPSAALDPRAEHDLFERFTTYAREAGARTGAVTVLVSHRLATVRDADLIVVLTDGAVAEQGSHAQLMAADGHYARLYSAQARGYR